MLRAICFSFLCLLPAPALAQTAADTSRSALEKVASEYPGISATVFVAGKKVWSAEVGHAGPAAKVTAATRFNIYSTSKALIGFAFARLIEDGRVTLDTTAGEIASELPPHLHHIRLKDILSHTSGVRHYNSPQDWLQFAQMRCLTPADALAYFQNDPLAFEPGTAEHYSSFAFVLASHLLTRISGEDDFAKALKETLGDWADFELDSDDADKSVPYIKAGLLPALPKGMSPDQIIPSPLPPASCKFGGGGLIAGSQDLAEAGAALADGRIVRVTKLTPWSDVSSVVYGGAIRKAAHRGTTVTTYSLSGGAPGGRSYLLVLLEPQISVAITGNIDGPNLEATAKAIADVW
jgi:serine beta-lactamase-like protein LACTB, mitochondrial